VWNFLKRDAKVTYFGYANSDRIEGRRVQLTNPDKSKTFASIYMHQNRVYITEATVPGNAPPPALFNQSMGFLDKDGVRVRYATPTRMRTPRRRAYRVVRIVRWAASRTTPNVHSQGDLFGSWELGVGSCVLNYFSACSKIATQPVPEAKLRARAVVGRGSGNNRRVDLNNREDVLFSANAAAFFPLTSRTA